MTRDNESPTITPEQAALVRIVETLDDIQARVGAIQARSVRIETRVSKLCLRAGLTHDGEMPHEEVAARVHIVVPLDQRDMSLTP